MAEAKIEQGRVPDNIEHAAAEIVSGRKDRRLSDKILIAFDHACDQRQFDIGADLLKVLEKLFHIPNLYPDYDRRRGAETLVAAHERLWFLRNMEQ